MTLNGRRGRRSDAENTAIVRQALRDRRRRDRLLESPLLDLPGVAARAAKEFGCETVPAVAALEAIVDESVDEAVQFFGDESWQAQFLREYVAGVPVDDIAAQLEVCRQHVWA